MRQKPLMKFFEYMSTIKQATASRTGWACVILSGKKNRLLAVYKNEFISYMCILTKDKQLKQVLSVRAREKSTQAYSMEDLDELMS